MWIIRTALKNFVSSKAAIKLLLILSLFFFLSFFFVRTLSSLNDVFNDEVKSEASLNFVIASEWIEKADFEEDYRIKEKVQAGIYTSKQSGYSYTIDGVEKDFVASPKSYLIEMKTSPKTLLNDLKLKGIDELVTGSYPIEEDEVIIPYQLAIESKISFEKLIGKNITVSFDGEVNIERKIVGIWSEDAKDVGFLKSTGYYTSIICSSLDDDKNGLDEYQETYYFLEGYSSYKAVEGLALKENIVLSESVYLTRQVSLFSNITVMKNLVQVISIVFGTIIFFALIFGLFIGMYSFDVERRKQKAMLRTLGATPKLIFGIMIIELAIIIVSGILLGFLVSFMTFSKLSSVVFKEYNINLVFASARGLQEMMILSLLFIVVILVFYKFNERRSLTDNI